MSQNPAPVAQAKRTAVTGVQNMTPSEAFVETLVANGVTDMFGIIARQQLTCGQHIHVSINSPDEGIAALDRIMVSRDLKVVDSGVHKTAASRRASDHLPIWADLAPRVRSL